MKIARSQLKYILSSVINEDRNSYPGIDLCEKRIMNRNYLRRIIIETLLEGEVIDLSQYKKVQDPKQEWYDLLNPESLKRYQQKSHLRDIESGDVLEFPDEPISEQKGASETTAYPGEIGVGISIPGKESGSGEAGGMCRALRVQMINAKAAYQAATQGPDKDAKQVALEDLEHAHEKECGS